MMELSIKEVATILGRSPRTVRAQVARGELPGVKRNGRWRVERRHLPLTEAQRRELQAKADSIRQAVEQAVPSRLARSHGQRTRSIVDLDAFRLGAEVLDMVRGTADEHLANVPRHRITGLIEGALLDLAEAAQQFDRELKLAAVNRARRRLSHALAALFIGTGMHPEEPVLSLVTSLEHEVLPAVAGFARWAEGLRRHQR